MTYLDQTDCIIGLIEGHLIPDFIGNMNAYFKQSIKCDFCKKVFLVEPLDLKCLYCHVGKLRYTVYPGMVVKYVDLIKNLQKNFQLPTSLKARLANLMDLANSTFKSPKSTNLRNLLDELDD